MKLEYEDISIMREKSGFGFHSCKEALRKLDGDINAAIRYLLLRGDCVVRYIDKASGQMWSDEDYIKAAKEYEK